MQQPKLITNFTINKEDNQHINIINKILEIIKGLNNSAFKTLLTFIINSNIELENVQQTLSNGLTIIDEQEENE